MTSGCGRPGQRTSKKLMERVRPGVELVLAIFFPSRELITLDLPTLDRPRNATSGKAGAGKWATLVAAVRNREKIRTVLVSTEGGEVASAAAQLIEAERTLIFDILVGDRPVLVAQVQQARNQHPQSNADPEEHAIRGKGNQHGNDDGRGNNQSRRAFHPD